MQEEFEFSFSELLDNFDEEREDTNDNSNNILGTSFRNLLLGTIDVQGFHMKPSFVKLLITQIRSKLFTKLMSLSL